MSLKLQLDYVNDLLRTVGAELPARVWGYWNDYVVYVGKNLENDIFILADGDYVRTADCQEADAILASGICVI